MDKITFHTEQRRIKDLLPYDHNPRKMSEEAAAQLTKSIEKFDLAEIPVINTDNLILAGHQRLKIMSALGRGDEVIDVRVPNRLLTTEEAQEYNIRSNKNTGEWDFEILGNAFDLDMLLDVGFTEKELGVDVLVDPEDDEVPEIPPVPVSELGDIYELGNHRVICGDSTDPTVLQALMGGFKADMYLTDPPYNVNYEGKTKDALKIENDEMSDEGFRVFLVDAFKAANDVMKPGAVFYIWHADSEGYNFRGACYETGWQVRQCLIWNKNVMVMGRQDYHWKHEPCLYGWKDGSAHLWNSDRTQTTILNFDRPSRNTEHPTMKPVELLVYQITNNTKGEDIVLDSFLGSGSTLIAADKVGRICFGVELDPKYVDVIVTRYCKYTGNNKIVKNGVEIEWEL